MEDRYGLVPATIKANHEREEMVDRQMQAAFALYHALRAIDERLDLEFITERADPEWGVIPGRWHVVRRNPPPAPDSYIPITTEDGGYREPDSGVLLEMQRRDLWRHGIPTHEEKAAARREYERTVDDEARVDELAHDLRAGARLPGDGGLSKRLWGKGGKKPQKGLVGS